jgi:hypothetical protein
MDLIVPACGNLFSLMQLHISGSDWRRLLSPALNPLARSPDPTLRDPNFFTPVQNS